VPGRGQLDPHFAAILGIGCANDESVRLEVAKHSRQIRGSHAFGFWGIRLTGRLPDWVSAKDVILEILRRHDVDGGLSRIIEYYGLGVPELKAMGRHVIANMGVEAGAVTTISPRMRRRGSTSRHRHCCDKAEPTRNCNKKII